jgi:DNA-binding NarL/FixJ family response regulator
MPAPVRVLIVDDNCVVRHAVAHALAADGAFHVVGTTGLGQDAPLSAIETTTPDVVLMPALARHTIDLTHAITRRFSGIRVVVLGVKDDPAAVTDAIEAGAVGYVPEEASVEECRETLRLVADGETRLDTRVAASVVGRLAALASVRRADERARNARLTPRETEILGLVAEGMTNKEIAAQLHVEEQTVKNHVHNVLERLGLRRRHEAVQYAWEAGMLRKRA